MSSDPVRPNRLRAVARFAAVRIACSLPLLAAPPALAQDAAPPPRAQVMILGTHHMDNPGLDYANPSVDDVLAPRRQAELAALARALAEFRPTRIAIESPPSSDSIHDARYQAYRAGSYSLTRNETDQVGYRLAAMLNHDRVYPVDYRLDMDFGGAMRWAAENGQGELAQRMGSTVQTLVAEMNDNLARGTVGASLAEANSARQDSLHGLYLLLATVGSDTTYRGAQEVASWYTRNLYIFANIARVAQPGERVLVIMGSGHGPLLRQFVDESPDLELVSTEPYLARFRTPAATAAR